MVRAHVPVGKCGSHLSFGTTLETQLLTEKVTGNYSVKTIS